MAQDGAGSPSGSFSTSTLSSAPQGVGVGGQEIMMEWGSLAGGAAAQDVVFRRPSAGAEYFRVRLLAGASVPLGPFRFVDGVELLASPTGGDIGVMIAFRRLE